MLTSPRLSNTSYQRAFLYQTNYQTTPFMRLDSIISKYNKECYPHCPPADDDYWDWCRESPNFEQVWSYLDFWFKWCRHAGKPPANYYRGNKKACEVKYAYQMCVKEIHAAFSIGDVIGQPAVIKICKQIYARQLIRSIKFNLAELGRFWVVKRRKNSDWFLEFVSRK